MRAIIIISHVTPNHHQVGQLKQSSATQIKWQSPIKHLTINPLYAHIISEIYSQTVFISTAHPLIIPIDRISIGKSDIDLFDIEFRNTNVVNGSILEMSLI